MKRPALRWPWRRRANRLGLGSRWLAPAQPRGQLVKLALIAGSGLAGVAIGTAFGDALLARFAPSLARVAALEIVGNVHTEPALLAAASGLGADLALADVEPDAIARALERLPWVRRARATTLTPNRVVIAIEERVPVAVARFADGSRHLVDAHGVAFALAPPGTRGPELLYAGAAPATQVVVPALAAGVGLLAHWNAAGLPPVRAIEVAGALGGELPAVQLADRELRVVLGGGDPREKLERLRRVLAVSEPGLARATGIDLRFPGQSVLRFAAPCPPGEKSLGEGAASGRDPGAAASLGGEKQCHAKTT